VQLLTERTYQIKVDSLAKKAIKAAHCTRQFIKDSFPYEQIWITMGGKKVTGPLRLELELFGGSSTAKKFFDEKGILLSANFDSVWWVGYNWAISSYTKTFCTFITKQVSGWCGCNSKLSLWEENVRNQCPQ
jgi:hypothetical protein